MDLNDLSNLIMFNLFIFSESGDRKKVQKSIEFPEVLDMTEFISPEYRGEDEKIVYQLNAVLIHKGRKVSSGHYIGELRDSYRSIFDISVLCSIS